MWKPPERKTNWRRNKSGRKSGGNQRSNKVRRKVGGRHSPHVVTERPKRNLLGGVSQFGVSNVEPLLKDVTSETLVAHLANLFDTYASTKRLWKKLLTPRSLIAPTTMFVHSKTYYAIADQNIVLGKVSKKEPVVVMETYGEMVERLLKSIQLGK